MDPSFPDEFLELDDDLFRRVLDSDIENENTILELIAREDIPALVLDKKRLKQFNWIAVGGNLFRRLMKISDERIINQWVGVSGKNPVSIFQFSFDTIDEYFVDIFRCRMFTSENSYVTCYDHLISSACAFLISMNQEQISVIEELLMQRLFFPGILQPMMASDLLCFMCRMSPKYGLELAEILFTILENIYFEDFVSSLPFITNGYRLTIEIILKLCQRILKFLDDQEIANLIALFPISSNLTLWSNFDSNCKVAEIHFAPQKEIFSVDELIFIAKFSTDHRSSIVGSIVENFVNCVDLYETLIYSRLLTYLKFELNFNQFSSLIKKLRYLLIENLDIFDCVIRINTLKLLKPLEFAADQEYDDKEFNDNLAELLIVLFNECKNTVDLFQFCVTTQNIFTNAFLFQALKKLSTQKMIHVKMKSHLEYLLDKEWTMGDPDAMTGYSTILAKTYRQNLCLHEKLMKPRKSIPWNFEHFILDATKFISYEELQKPNNQTKYTIIDLWPFTNDAQENYELLSILVERMRQISFNDSNEKMRFLKVAQELIRVIIENDKLGENTIRLN